MKILQIGKYFYPFRGGIETVVQNLSEGLHAKGNAVTVLCSSEKRSGNHYCLDNEFEIIKAPKIASLFSQPINLGLSKLMAENIARADVVHFHTPNPLVEFMSLFIPKTAPFIVTYHADVIRQKLLIPFYRPILRAFLNRADKIVVPTENHIRYSPILREFESKCEIIPFGIPADKFKLTGHVGNFMSLHQRQLGPYFLFIGRLVPYKGLRYLIEAMAKVNTNLVLIGDGPERPMLESMASELGIRNKIHFLGKVDSEAELVGLIHGSEGLVLPSITSAENFGLVQLEAMACSRPVIVTRLESGVSCVGEHLKTCYMVEPRDSMELGEAMSSLLRNSQMAIDMGKNGKERFLNHFTIEKMVQGHLDLYNKLSGGNVKQISKNRTSTGSGSGQGQEAA